MLKKRKGQTALEYAALLVVLAAVVAVFIWGTGGSEGSLRGKVEKVYTRSTNKVSAAHGWLKDIMKGDEGE
jgi:Flp pilus assembly pilin Flp